MKLAYVAAVQAKPNADGAANYPYAPLSEEQAEHWFSGGSDDVSGPAVGSGRATRMMGWWLGRIEAAVGDNGFAVGSKLSLADVLVCTLPLLPHLLVRLLMLLLMLELLQTTSWRRRCPTSRPRRPWRITAR